MTKQFTTLNVMPKSAVVGGMNPETRRIIKQIKNSRGKVLACKLKSPHAAKIRMDALRRARKRGTVRFKEAHRTGSKLYFRLR